MDSDRTETQNIILYCVLSIPGKLPRSGVAKLLVGSHSQRVIKYTDHPDFGRLSHLPRYAVLVEIDTLINLGELDLDEKSRVIVKEKFYS
jgi:hypothetical protein